MDGLFDKNGNLICEWKDIVKICKGDYKEKEKVYSISIPEGVTDLRYSFEGFSSLEDVTFPKTFKCIGFRDFCDCKKLEKIDLSNTKVYKIDGDAFENCENLNEVIFPNNLTFIGGCAFYNCKNLKEIDLSNTQVECIYPYTFKLCENLTSFVGSPILKKFHMNAFKYCKNIEIFNIANTKVEEFNCAQVIGDCKKLKEIYFPSTLKVLKEGKLFKNNIDSLKIINFSLLKYDEFQKRILNNYPELEDAVVSSKYGLFDKDDNLVCSYNKISSLSKEERDVILRVVLPNKTHHIYVNEFKNYAYLREIIFNKNLNEIKEKAFMNCENLEHIDLSNTQVKQIGDDAFRGCDNLTNVSFPSTLINIGDNAFKDCWSLEKIDFSKVEDKDVINKFIEDYPELEDKLVLPDNFEKNYKIEFGD